MQGLGPLAEEERPPLGLHAAALHPPVLDGANLIPPQRVGGGEAPFEAGDVEDAALDDHLLQHQAAGLGDPEPMTKHQQQQATVTGFAATTVHSRQEPLKFPAGEVLVVVHTASGSVKATSMSRAPCSTPQSERRREWRDRR